MLTMQELDVNYMSGADNLWISFTSLSEPGVPEVLEGRLGTRGDRRLDEVSRRTGVSAALPHGRLICQLPARGIARKQLGFTSKRTAL